MGIYSIPPLLTLVCYVALGILTFHRGLKTVVNRLLFFICLSGVFLYLDILIIFNTNSRAVALLSSRVDHCFVAFNIPLFIHFFHAYFQITNRKWVLFLAYGYAVFMIPFAFTPFLIESMHHYRFGFFGRGGSLYPLIGAGAFCTLVYCVSKIVMAIRCATSSIQKNKLKYLLIGFGMMGMMNALNVVPILGYPIYPPGVFGFLPLIVFGVGLFKYDLLDMGVILKKSLLYSLITATLVFIFSLAVILVEKVLGRFWFKESMQFTLVFFLVVATVFGPLKSFIMKYIDRVFYKKKYGYQKTIRDLGQTIASTMDVNEIARNLSNTVVQKIMLTHCHLFLKDHLESNFQIIGQHESRGRHGEGVIFQPASPLVVFLKKYKKPVVKRVLLDQLNSAGVRGAIDDMEAISAAVVLPLFFRRRFRGFISFGQKMSDELFGQEDIDLLLTLSVQTSLAIENASAYKRLDLLNQTLEFQVEKRTKALQQALSEQAKTQEQLIRSESLAAIGQLVAGTAHELNNPLSSSISLVQSVVETLDNVRNEVVRECMADLAFVDKELGRAKSIISSLLGLSRQTQTYSETVDLNAVVKDALQVLSNQFKHERLTVVTEFSDNLPLISGNFSNLGQVAINIIQNAIQSVAHNKGKIMLSTGYETGRKRVVFTCKDTGTGMAHDIEKDVFKPFFTTKEVGSGTGLGLYICHEIVKKHSGSITVDSQPGKGALFRVMLPVA